EISSVVSNCIPGNSSTSKPNSDSSPGSTYGAGPEDVLSADAVALVAAAVTMLGFGAEASEVARRALACCESNVVPLRMRCQFPELSSCHALAVSLIMLVRI